MEKKDLQSALDLIEERLEEKLGAEELAKRIYTSAFHFQRTFGMVCGISLGDYIRRRRLSRAALDLQRGAKVLDTALKYGYQTSESFSRAFMKFHGVKPMQAKRGAPVENFAPIDLSAEGEPKMACRIGELPARTLVGFKKHFCGAPYGEERLKQEHEFYSATRGMQWLLFGASGGKAEEYAVATNFTEEGYDYFIAYELDDWARKEVLDGSVAASQTGGKFEELRLGSCRAAVFETPKSVHPIADYSALRASLMRFMNSYDFEFADLPELVVYHWHLPRKEERYIEICLPIV